MKEYKVSVEIIIDKDYIVEAKDIEHAKELAVDEAEFDFPEHYSIGVNKNGVYEL